MNLQVSFHFVTWCRNSFSSFSSSSSRSFSSSSSRLLNWSQFLSSSIMTSLQLVSLFGLSVAVLTLCRDFDLEAVRHDVEEKRAKREAALEAVRRYFEEKEHAERRRRVLEDEWRADLEASRRRFREGLRRVRREMTEKAAPEHVPEKPTDPVAPEKIQTVSSAEGRCDEVMREGRRLRKPPAESPIALNTSRPIVSKHLAPNELHVPPAFTPSPPPHRLMYWTSRGSLEGLPPTMSELRVVLLGNRWSERSSVGNIILKNSEFNSEEEPDRCLRARGQWDQKAVVVINSPDLLHPNIPHHKLTEFVKECVSLSAPGPHVFLLVLQPEDFTEEQRQRLCRTNTSVERGATSCRVQFTELLLF
ncbi:hypothetical protein INR49_004487 [Caranx melampygus]|nr:hypothetical protein INR49_004487 [Caranx melampygus]